MKINKNIIKNFKTVPVDELPKAPVYALRGISYKSALTLYKAFYVETIKDLAELEYTERAKQICEAADSGQGEIEKDTSEKWLIKKYRNEKPAVLAEAPVSAMFSISKKNARLLKRDFGLHTVRDLAEFRFVKWARTIDYRQKLIKKYESYSLSDLVHAPVEALQGLSTKDAKLLKDAFYVDTIGDLGELKYYKWAKEICNAAFSSKSIEDLENKLIKRYEKKSVEELPSSPVQALQGVSKGDADKLKKAFNVKTIEDLATLKYARWAQDILDLNEYALNTEIEDEPEKKSLWRYIVGIIFLIAALLTGWYVYKNIITAEKKTVPETTSPETGIEDSTQEEGAFTEENEKDKEKDLVSEQKETEKKQEADKADNIYIIGPGDTLVSISEKLYKDYSKWKEIYRLNKDKINKPWEIFPGQKLRLPERPAGIQ